LKHARAYGFIHTPCELLQPRNVNVFWHGTAEEQAATLEARLARITAEAALARLFGRIPFGDNP